MGKFEHELLYSAHCTTEIVRQVPLVSLADHPGHFGGGVLVVYNGRKQTTNTTLVATTIISRCSVKRSKLGVRFNGEQWNEPKTEVVSRRFHSLCHLVLESLYRTASLAMSMKALERACPTLHFPKSSFLNTKIGMGCL